VKSPKNAPGAVCDLDRCSGIAEGGGCVNSEGKMRGFMGFNGIYGV